MILFLEYMSIHLDTNVVFEKNSKKEGLRKNGCLINSGSMLFIEFYLYVYSLY